MRTYLCIFVRKIKYVMDYKNIDPAKLMETLFTEHPLELYDYLLEKELIA